MTSSNPKSRLEQQDEYQISQLMPVLRGKGSLWHRTSIPGLRSIVRDGVIRTSDDPVLGDGNSSDVVRSAGYRFGAVSLFDFDAAALNDVFRMAQHWHTFLSHFYPATVVIQLERTGLSTSALIQQDRPKWMPPIHHASHGGPHYPNWIPQVEAWHRGPISLDVVRGILLFRSGSGNHFEKIDLHPDCVSEAEAFAKRWQIEDKIDSARSEQA